MCLCCAVQPEDMRGIQCTPLPGQGGTDGDGSIDEPDMESASSGGDAPPPPAGGQEEGGEAHAHAHASGMEGQGQGQDAGGAGGDEDVGIASAEDDLPAHDEL